MLKHLDSVECDIIMPDVDPIPWRIPITLSALLVCSVTHTEIDPTCMPCSSVDEKN